MTSSKKTIDRDWGQGCRRPDERRKDAENCDARPIEAEGVSVHHNPFRDELRDRDPKPEKTRWNDSFKKFDEIGPNSITT